MSGDINYMTKDSIEVSALGCTLVCDRQETIVAATESLGLLFKLDSASLLLQPLQVIIDQLPADVRCSASDALEALKSEQLNKKTIIHALHEKVFYLTISTVGEHIILQWEPQVQDTFSASELGDVGLVFEQYPANILQLLCDAMQRILDIDRVCLLRVSETGNSQIVAEKNKAMLPSVKHLEFSDSFMPAETLRYYQTRDWRYCRDLGRGAQTLHTIEPDIARAEGPLAMMPSQVSAYMKTKGIVTVLSYPLWLDGDFWGILYALHTQCIDIDLQKRNLCGFLVQHAANTYENLLKQNRLDLDVRSRETEQGLRSKFEAGESINHILKESLPLLMELLSADGVAIYDKGEIQQQGLAPDEQLLEAILAFICEQPKRPLFKDYNFRLRHADRFDSPLPFAGLLGLQVGNRDDHFIVWFRGEHKRDTVQLAPEDAQQRGVSDATAGYQFWIEPIADVAKLWDEKDLTLVRNLHQLLNNSIIAKAKEQEKSNESLASLNNELEMLTFTLSHDLKNPLSIVKMGIQYMQSQEELSSMQKKWFNTILKGVDDIENIVNYAVKISRTKTYTFTTTPVPMAKTIRSLCQEARVVHGSDACTFQYGDLLPVCGEKGMLYQIFLNIINNAVKYSSTQGAPLVRIYSERAQNKLHYYVEDNGIGIPSENIAHIFDVFIRASNSQSFEGTGIGLGLVKRIIERLGGAVFISSQQDEGTKVKLEFPTDC